MKNTEIIQQNKSSKMGLLYNYMTGQEFSRSLKAMVKGYEEIKIGYEKEKMQMLKIWKNRENQLNNILNSTMDFYGTIKGIANEEIVDIDFLEPENHEQKLL